MLIDDLEHIYERYLSDEKLEREQLMSHADEVLLELKTFSEEVDSKDNMIKDIVKEIREALLVHIKLFSEGTIPNETFHERICEAIQDYKNL